MLLLLLSPVIVDSCIWLWHPPGILTVAVPAITTLLLLPGILLIVQVISLWLFPAYLIAVPIVGVTLCSSCWIRIYSVSVYKYLHILKSIANSSQNCEI